MFVLGSKKEVETLEELYIKGDWTPPFLAELSSQVPTVEVLVPPRVPCLKRTGKYETLFCVCDLHTSWYSVRRNRDRRTSRQIVVEDLGGCNYC